MCQRTDAITIFNSYDLFTKHLHISSSCIEKKTIWKIKVSSKRFLHDAVVWCAVCDYGISWSYMCTHLLSNMYNGSITLATLS